MPRTALLLSAVLLLAVVSPTASRAADDPLPVSVDRFEGEVPFASQPAEGIFTWGGDGDDPPALRLTARADAPEGEKVLTGAYDISAYGGFTHDFAAGLPAHDWSAHRGVRFWWEGRGTGKKVPFEIKDGGANGEASELWTTAFTDDFTGWKQIELPFGDFVYRTDYQPVGGIDHVLGLTHMWGYALTLPAGDAGTFAMDDVELYGRADQALRATVTTDAAVYPVREGGTATVSVTVATTASAPLGEPVTVAYATAGGTARPGGDYTPVSGTLTFPAGTPSGTTRTVTVRTLRDKSAEPAETVPLTLTVTGARAPAETPEIVVDANGLPYLNAALPVRKRVADLLSRMSLKEKAGQMTQAERAAVGEGADVTAQGLGSLLSGGGSTPTPNTPEAWAKMIDGFQLRTQATRLQIPLIYGVDAVHGHNNLVGATIMPHNIGIGATRDPQLAEQAGSVTASEVRATGVPWDFAPACASPATNAGDAPTSPSARTRPSSSPWRPSCRASRAAPTDGTSRTTTRSSPPPSTSSATAAPRTARPRPAPTPSTRASPRSPAGSWKPSTWRRSGPPSTAASAPSCRPTPRSTSSATDRAR